jgi:hypothetical protein
VSGEIGEVWWSLVLDPSRIVVWKFFNRSPITLKFEAEKRERESRKRERERERARARARARASCYFIFACKLLFYSSSKLAFYTCNLLFYLLVVILRL